MLRREPVPVFFRSSLGVIVCSVVASACAGHRNPINMYPYLTPALTLETRGLTINYTRDSLPNDQGPVLVLIHGFGASLQSWNDIYPALARRHSVVRLDLKGSGFSSKPHDDKYSPDDQAHLLWDFIVGLNLHRVVLIGHSLGGGIALLTTLAAHFGTSIPKIEGLVLIDSAGFPQQLPFFVEAFRNPLLLIINNLLTATFKTRITLKRLFVVRNEVTEERVWRYAYFLTLDGTEAALRSTAKALTHTNDDRLAKQLPMIRIPTLIIWGQNDPAIPVRNAEMFHRAIAGSTVSILPQTGHVPHEERPEETFKVIQDFLETIR